MSSADGPLRLLKRRKGHTESSAQLGHTVESHFERVLLIDFPKPLHVAPGSGNVAKVILETSR